MSSFIGKHKKIVGIVGGIIGLCVAAVYVFVTPPEAKETQGFVSIILTYGHSACWVLLSVACGTWGATGRSRVPMMIGFGALGLYLVFIGTLLFV